MAHWILVIVLLSLVIAWASLAPWVPTRTKDLERINKIAKLKPRQTFLEMGCGNGRVCSYIAKKNPQAKVIGIELAFLFYLFTKIRVVLFGPKNLQIVFGNALKYDISKVDVLYVFGLIDTVNTQIKEKVLREMKANAKLISYMFAMKEWKGKQKTYKEAPKIPAIHVYQLAKGESASGGK